MHGLIKPFLRIYDENITAETVAEIEYPFSVPIMDASYDFNSVLMREIRRYCKSEYKITADQVLIITGFFSGMVQDPERVQFNSRTRLAILKRDDKKHIAVLFLGAEIIRE